MQGSIRNIADVGAEIEKQARSLGIASTEFEAFANLLRGEGIRTTRFVNSLNKLEIAIQKDSDALKDLGTSANELLKIESPLERFRFIVERLRQTGNVAAASTIVGERDIQILLRLASLSKEIVTEAYNEQRAISFSEGTTKALQNISQAFANLDTAIRKTWGDAVAREEERILNSLAKLLKGIRFFVEFASKHFETILSVLRLIGTYIVTRLAVALVLIGGKAIIAGISALAAAFAALSASAATAGGAIATAALALRRFPFIAALAIGVDQAIKALGIEIGSTTKELEELQKAAKRLELPQAPPITATNVTDSIEKSITGIDSAVEAYQFLQRVAAASAAVIDKQRQEQEEINRRNVEIAHGYVERFRELENLINLLVSAHGAEAARLLPLFNELTEEMKRIESAIEAAGVPMKVLRDLADEIALDTITTRQKMEEIARVNPVRGNVLLGLQDVVDRGEQAFGLIREGIDRTFMNLEDGLVRFIETGKVSFSGLVRSIGADISRLLTRRLFGQLVGNILGGLNFGGGSFAGQSSFNTGNTFHQGGIVTGRRGLRQDEVPIIAQVGERILPRGAPPPGVTINLNNYGTQQQVIGQEVSMDRLGNMVINVLEDDYYRGGRTRNLIRQGAA